MENTVRLTIRNNVEPQNNKSENISTYIDLVVSLSPEKSFKLKEAVENIAYSKDLSSAYDLFRLLSDCGKSSGKINPLSDTQTTVTALMNKLGIPAHTKGYRYLRDAIVMSAEKPEVIEQVTKVLYPAIAEIHNTTPVRVERVIRHAIEYCCLKGNTEAVSEYFSHCLSSKRGKPTNSEFIAILSDKLRMQT